VSGKAAPIVLLKFCERLHQCFASNWSGRRLAVFFFMLDLGFCGGGARRRRDRRLWRGRRRDRRHGFDRRVGRDGELINRLNPAPPMQKFFSTSAVVMRRGCWDILGVSRRLSRRLDQTLSFARRRSDRAAYHRAADVEERRLPDAMSIVWIRAEIRAIGIAARGANDRYAREREAPLAAARDGDDDQRAPVREAVVLDGDGL
jgi:hypothetical protein